jgi:hypothetical protein
MHRVTVVLITILLATGTGAPLVGQDHNHQAVTDGGVLPAGWLARPDDGGTAKNVKFVNMGKDYHLTLGTATLLYRQNDQGNGPFHVLAKFTQTKAPGQHPEAYGLFYGGKELSSADQQYFYFLVRGDGKYLIKRRKGNKVTEVKSWTAHPAIQPADAKGQATNLLAIEAKQSPTKVVFMANGQAVDSTTVTADDMNGVVGIRANHNLDLHISGFAVQR